jgi:hypothetical protein
MTKSELEQQAKEFNVSVAQIKEWRKHIKPYLRYCINKIKSHMDENNFLCIHLIDYKFQNGLDMAFENYIKSRLSVARPDDSWVVGYPKTDSFMNSVWYHEVIGQQKIKGKPETNRLKIAFCRQQLKLVKP